MISLRLISKASGLSVSSLGRHSQHARRELALPIPPTGDTPTADLVTDALGFVGRMQAVLTTITTVQDAARATGSAGLLLAAVKTEAAALESLRRGVGVDPVSIRDKLTLLNAVVKGVGYICRMRPEVAPILAKFFSVEAADPKADLSAKARSDLQQLSERLSALADNGAADNAATNHERT